MTVDIEGQIKPMAAGLVKGLDTANKDGVANDVRVSEAAACIYVMMKRK